MFTTMMMWFADIIEGFVKGAPLFWEFMNQEMFSLGDIVITPLSLFSISGIIGIITYKFVRFLLV